MLSALVIGLDFLPHCLVHFMLASFPDPRPTFPDPRLTFPDPRPTFRCLQYGKAGGA